MSHFVELKFIATIRHEEMSHITHQAQERLLTSDDRPGGGNVNPAVKKNTASEREWLSEFKWKEVRAVQSCGSISVMTNLSE